MFIRIKNICYYNVYILKLKLSINYLSQRTHKFVTNIFRKTCSPLVKIISDGENNLKQNKYNKLQKISAKNKCFCCCKK